MFSMDKHVIRGNPDGPGLYYIAIDYGTMNPTAMGLWRVYRGEAVDAERSIITMVGPKKKDR